MFLLIASDFPTFFLPKLIFSGSLLISRAKYERKCPISAFSGNFAQNGRYFDIQGVQKSDSALNAWHLGCYTAYLEEFEKN